MKHQSLHCLFFLFVVGIGLTACRSDVNLGDTSVESKVTARVSLPIGEISTSFGNLIGLIADHSKIHSDANGVMYLSTSEHRDGDFHTIDLTEYIGTTNSSKLISEAINPAPPFLPAGEQVDVPFTLIIDFKGVNNSVSTERLDSLVIERARFTTHVETQNFDITDNDIQKVVMKLSQQFRRPKGKEIELTNFHLGQDVSIEIDDFTLIMMDDVTKKPGRDNVVQNADITFVITLKTGDNVVVNPTSGLSFDFKVEMMEYSALYGFFKADTGSGDKDKVDIPLNLPGGEQLILPIKDPELKMKFTYGMSMPLNVNINELKGVSNDGSEHPAYWGSNGDSTHVTIPLETMVAMDDPVDKQVTDSSVVLNNDPLHGNISDRIFKYDLKSLAYDYDVQVDTMRVVNGAIMDQFRLTKNTHYTMDLYVDLPFDFNPGLKIVYKDTIKNVNLEAASLDSLAKQSGGLVDTVRKAELDLYLTVTNEIPVSLTLDAALLDENDNTLPFTALQNIYMEGADVDATGKVTAKVSVPHCKIKTDEFKQLSKTKKIVITARVGDDIKPSTFYDNKKLTIKAGVTADIEAVITLETLLKGNNK